MQGSLQCEIRDNQYEFICMANSAGNKNPGFPAIRIVTLIDIHCAGRMCRETSLLLNFLYR